VIDVFDDTKIAPGRRWNDEIARALAAARCAVLLVSADFLASDFIHDNELPTLLRSAQDDGAAIIPIVISSCAFAQHPQLSAFQAVNPPDRPLIDMPKGEQELVLTRVAAAIADVCATPSRPLRRDA
jgi:hypothetical protein